MSETRAIFLKKKICVLLFLVVSLISVSCSESGTSGPRTWIDNPRDGAALSPGKAVVVKSHVFAKGGVAEVLLTVNGEPYRRDTPPESSEFVAIKQEWIPDTPGTYQLQVQGYDSQGIPAQPASIIVEVVGKTEVVAAQVVSVTPVITVTPTVTLTPTMYISVTPEITRTPTNLPGSNVSFYAKPENLKAGECTTMYWAVQNAQRVIFGGKDQPFVGSYQDCLCSTQRFTLRVIDLDGTDKSYPVTINVSGSCTTDVPPQQEQPVVEQPAPVVDKTPPSVPIPAVPANGLTIPCKTSQTLVWQPSKDDSSGIAGYYVKLEIQVKKGSWQSAGGYGPVTDKQVNVKVQCGGIYRWMVRAQDGAGNVSAWSSPSTFSVVLN